MPHVVTALFEHRVPPHRHLATATSPQQKHHEQTEATAEPDKLDNDFQQAARLLAPPLELVAHAPGRLALEVGHRHDLDDEAGPAGKVLRALAGARRGVVLLPREARGGPAVVDRVDDVAAEARVQVAGDGLVQAGLGGDVLCCGLAVMPGRMGWRGRTWSWTMAR